MHLHTLQPQESNSSTHQTTANTTTARMEFANNRADARGYQRVSSMVATSPRTQKAAHWQHQADAYTANSSPIQLKKTIKPPLADLAPLVGNGIEASVVGALTGEEKRDAIWTKLNTEYDDCYAKGNGYMDLLEAAIVAYNDAARRDTILQQIATKKARSTGRYTDNYATTVHPLSPSRYRVNTKGYNPDEEARPDVGTDEYEGDYSNEFDLAHRTIKAAWNFAEYDTARSSGKGINNSEILYRQYKDAAEAHYHGQDDKDASVAAAIRGVSKITRNTIINDTTLATIFMAYPNGVKPSDRNETWNADTNDGKALLGTPNAKSTPFLLMDHLDDMERTIDNIQVKGGDNLEINLTDI